MEFRVYLESESGLVEHERRDFLAQHFANPADEKILLVFADWLEEHGDPFAGAIRHAISGQFGSASASNADREAGREVLLAAWERVRNQVHISAWNSESRYQFQLRGRGRSQTHYWVTNHGIMRRTKGDWKELPESEWTEDIVNGALFLIMRQLTDHSPSRYRGEEGIHQSGGGIERYVQGVLIRLLHAMEHLGRMLWGRHPDRVMEVGLRKFLEEGREAVSVLHRYKVRQVHLPLVTDIRDRLPGLRENLGELMHIRPQLGRLLHDLEVLLNVIEDVVDR